jgi:alcohol dehydrogenase (NADP+)
MSRQTYKALEKTLKSGKTKAIGVSNFSRKELERLLKETLVVPAVHQVELHPWLQQPDFFEFHKAKGIHISQYSPLVSCRKNRFLYANGRSFGNQNGIYSKGKNLGKLIDEPTIVQIGKKHGKSGAQVALGKFISRD